MLQRDANQISFSDALEASLTRWDGLLKRLGE